jgi:ABC-type cobalt transport system substrate-binding protein
MMMMMMIIIIINIYLLIYLRANSERPATNQRADAGTNTESNKVITTVRPTLKYKKINQSYK